MSKDEYSGLVGIGDVVYTKTRSVFPVNTFVLCANIWSFDRRIFFLARNEREIGTRRLRIHFQIRTSRNCKKGFSHSFFARTLFFTSFFKMHSLLKLIVDALLCLWFRDLHVVWLWNSFIFRLHAAPLQHFSQELKEHKQQNIKDPINIVCNSKASAKILWQPVES